jgi:hypothetical protein
VLTWIKKPSPQATRVRPGQEAGCFDGNGYRTLLFRRKQYLGHRVAWALHHGRWPEELDHKDRNPSNNKLANLRECSHTDNCANMLRPAGISGVRGAVWNKKSGKWQAQFKRAGKTQYLGLFETAEEAASAWIAAKTNAAGEFARTAA